MKQIPLFLVLLSVFINLAGCERDKTTPASTIKPHLVEVATAELKDVSVSRQRNGTLRAIQEIQIFNQEEGQIAKLPFLKEIMLIKIRWSHDLMTGYFDRNSNVPRQ